MSLPLTAALVLGAVLVFWVIGAYNRLVVLRNAIADAWAKVQEVLDQRGAAVEPLVAALRLPMAAEQGALETWLAAHADAIQAAAAMAALPVTQVYAQAWVAAEGVLGAAASRVLALLEQQVDLQHQDPVASLTASWRDSQARLPFARQFFNHAARDYNEAADLFPTRLVARGFGLSRAGTL